MSKRVEWEWAVEWRWHSIAVGVWWNALPDCLFLSFQPIPFLIIFATRWSGGCVEGNP